MLIHCGIETAGPKTKGYTSTVLTLCLMALEAARACELKTQAEYEEYVNGFQGALDALEGEIAQARAWYDRNEESLMKLKKCFVVEMCIRDRVNIEPVSPPACDACCMRYPSPPVRPLVERTPGWLPD